MANDRTDDIYYAHGMRVPLAQRLAIYARKKMFEHFMLVMAPDAQTRILDFGTSEAATEEANILEKQYPYVGNITCAGIGDGERIRGAFPKIHYCSITPNARLPFADKSFDIAYCNAVLEHVGSDQARVLALEELDRIAMRIYVTVPNRWFPVEHHTGLPFLHYSKKAFRALTATTSLAYWANEANLEFLSRRRLVGFFPNSVRTCTAYVGVKLGIFSSNIAVWTTES